MCVWWITRMKFYQLNFPNVTCHHTQGHHTLHCIATLEWMDQNQPTYLSSYNSTKSTTQSLQMGIISMLAHALPLPSYFSTNQTIYHPTKQPTYLQIYQADAGMLCHALP